MDKLKECKIENGYIKTNYGQVIKHFILPDISYVTAETSKFLDELVSKNIEIVFMGEERLINGLNFIPAFVDNKKESRLLEEFDPYINVMHMVYNEGEIFFIANTIDQDKEIALNINCDNKNVLIYDPYNNTTDNAIVSHNGNSIKISIDGYKAKMLMIF